MKQSKPRTRQPQTKPAQVPYGYKRKNGRLVVDPGKKKIVQELYGKFANDPEFLMKPYEAIAAWWHKNNSRVAKKEYQQRLARQQQGGGK
ncbi:hypothetical protein ANRL3_00057 [Anaerolineae bacterium]|nr:hypothetical protein ANRL3_00057 [Anaerolineae bacterium]